MIRTVGTLCLVLMLCTAQGITWAEDQEKETEKDPVSQDERMGWWRDARFGMFIHWGLYSVLGGEWKGVDHGKECGGASAEWIMKKGKVPRQEYRKLSEQFNPVKFDAKEWVSLAVDAGMKYMVITAKHHDGFCLFDTEHTDYNIVDATPFKRDVIKELADECAKQGLKFGVYYSQFQDWYHRGLEGRGGTMSQNEYLKMVDGNLDELLTKYGDMWVLWFDTGGSNLNEANRQGEKVRKMQPKAIICGRLYKRTVPMAQQKYTDFVSLPDRSIATARVDGDTETCMTMRHNWGYDQDDDNWKSAKDLIERMVLSSSRGVNYLLNVGPTPEGSLCEEEIDRLKAIGSWMKVNNESIYGTTASPLDFDFEWGCMTQKENKLYLHVMKWDETGIAFHGIKNKPVTAYMLTDQDKKALDIEQDTQNNSVTVKVSGEAPDENNSVIVLEFEDGIEIDENAKGKYHWIKTTGLKHGDKNKDNDSRNKKKKKKKN